MKISRLRSPLRRSATRSCYLRSADGYTLPELLIASILVAALMASVWNLMSMYNLWMTAGQSDTTTQQIARSLFRIIRTDIDSVARPDRSRSQKLPQRLLPETFTIEPSLSLGTETGFAGDALPSQDQTRGTSQTDGEVIIPELTGTRDFLQLTGIQWPELPMSELNVRTEQTPEEFPVAASGETDPNWSDERKAPEVAEFQTVVYQFERQTRTAAASTEQLPAGLHRIQLESLPFKSTRQSLSTQDSEQNAFDELNQLRLNPVLLELLERADSPADGNADSSTSDSDSATERPDHGVQYEYVPEVIACEFSYLSDQIEHSSWRSSERGYLPDAVRVRFRLSTQEDQEKYRRETVAAMAGNDNPGAQNTAETTSESSSTDGSELNSDSDTRTRRIRFKSQSFERILLIQNQRPQSHRRNGQSPEDFAQSPNSEPSIGGANR